ncbi:MAG: hypothetical protein AAFW76_02495 [Pseudomonadota bacterium]
MASSNDPQDIARRYLDLWLDHWERSARDPEAVDAMARMVQEAVSETADFQRRMAMGLSALTPGNAASPFGPWLEIMRQTAERTAKEDGDGSADSGQPADPAGTDGTAPAGPASGDGAERVAQLLQRIAELESRIEHLERTAPAASRRGKSTQSTSRRRTKRPG